MFVFRKTKLLTVKSCAGVSAGILFGGFDSFREFVIKILCLNKYKNIVFTIYTVLREAEIHKMPRNEYELQGHSVSSVAQFFP